MYSWFLHSWYMFISSKSLLGWGRGPYHCGLKWVYRTGPWRHMITVRWEGGGRRMNHRWELKYWEGSLPQCHFVTTIPHGLRWDWIRSSAVRSQRLSDISQWRVKTMKFWHNSLFIHLSPRHFVYISWILILLPERRVQSISAADSTNSGNRHHLQRPSANFSCSQKSAYCAGIKICNSLPSNLRSLMNKKAQCKVEFKTVLTYSLFWICWEIPNV
jgi:hypothetical protein